MEALRHLNKYLIRYRRQLALGAVFMIVANILSIAPASLIRHAFSLIQENATGYQSTTDAYLRVVYYKKLRAGLLIYSGLILLTAILRGIFSCLSRWTMMVVSKHIEYTLRNEIYAHYQTLPLSFYQKHSTGDLMSRISEDVNQVGMYLGPAIMYGLNTAIIFLVLFPHMLMTNAYMTLYTMPPIILLAVATYYISTPLQKRSKAVQRQLAELVRLVQESSSGIKVLQTFNREAGFIRAFTKGCDSYKAKSLHLTMLNTVFFPAAKAIVGLGTALVVFMGGRAVIQGSKTPGDIAEFIMYMNLLAWPVFSISWINSMVQKAAASQERILAFLRAENPIVSEKNIKSPIRGLIAFKDVSFTYEGSKTRALRSVNFTITAGKTTAIIGTTGAGKSTVLRLISRLYNVETGEITIDGVPIQDYDVSYLRQQLGYVPQDVFLFSDTLTNNIAWGKPRATTPQVMQAAQWAEIHTYLEQLPKQAETRLGEKGIMLSGGQKQRATIARALIRRPKILILDDGLSAVDTQTERKILCNIAEAMRGSTVLLVSHRVTSVQFADHILVLEAGALVEQGSHEALLARKGAYYTLYEQQQPT